MVVPLLLLRLLLARLLYDRQEILLLLLLLLLLVKNELLLHRLGFQKEALCRKKQKVPCAWCECAASVCVRQILKRSGWFTRMSPVVPAFPPQN